MTCKNVFLEDDGFCTQCGRNHLVGASKRGKRSTPAPAPRKADPTQMVFSLEAGVGLAPQSQIQVAPPVVTVKVADPRPARRPPQPLGLSYERYELTMRTVEIVMRDFNFTAEIVFSARKHGSNCIFYHVTGRRVIKFGVYAINSFADNGLNTTLKSQNALTMRRFGCLPRGRVAVVLHALHELAHVVTNVKYGPYHHHDNVFFEVYESLVDRYLSTIVNGG